MIVKSCKLLLTTGSKCYKVFEILLHTLIPNSSSAFSKKVLRVSNTFWLSINYVIADELGTLPEGKGVIAF